jgi:predicted secreted hydrolase
MKSLTRIAALLVAAQVSGACGGPEPGAGGLALGELLSGADEGGFERADRPRRFRFPEDHGSHPTFRSEWWYVTGNLEGAGGRAFGFHLTLFRRGLPGSEARSASLAAQELWMAHFAIADQDTERVHAHERTSRGAGGLAGATLGAEGLEVWLEDWSLRMVEGLEDGALPVIELTAREGADALALRLVAERAPVLQGDAGLSVKGAGPGQASYYYAVTRLSATGALELDGRSFDVEGSAWLDREWSTSVLGPEQVGWDWFALQLEDDTELMLYQMRLADGGVDETSHGSLTRADGSHRKLGFDTYSLEVLERWRSPTSAADYPARWRVRVPEEGLELEVTPLFSDQELPLAVVYWEGAVRVRGVHGEEPIEGVGFVELTGYAGAAGR